MRKRGSWYHNGAGIPEDQCPSDLKVATDGDDGDNE